jgi:WD40 repeat protein
VLIAQGNSLSLLDGQSCQITQILRHPGRDEAHESAISDIRVSGDGLVLASSSDQARIVRLWETASGRLLASLPVLEGLEQIDFAPSTSSARAGHEHTLAVLTGPRVHLHEVGGFDVEQFAGLQAWPILACTPGKQGSIAFVSGDRRTHQGSLTLMSGGRSVWRRDLELPEERLPVRLHADPRGQWLAHTEGKGLGLTPTGRPGDRVVVSPGEVQSLAFTSESGLWLATGKRIEKRSLPSGKADLTWDNALGDMLTGLGNLYAVAPGRKYVLAGGRDGCLRLLDAGTGKLLNNWKMCSSPILSVALSSDEQLGLVGTWKGGVCLVRLPSGEKIAVPAKHGDRVESVVFLRADLFATGSADRTIRLWYLDREVPRAWLTLKRRRPVKSLSASANGDRLTVLLCNERAVRILDLKRLRAHLARLGLE